MKKILSLCLAFCMLFSLTTVYADGNKTKISHEGEAVSEWEINVPMEMAPGQSGIVTVSGTWTTEEEVYVSVPEIVTLVSSIDGETRDLEIDFGIAHLFSVAGNNNESITETTTISVAEMTGGIFGVWEGFIVYDVKIETIKPELNKDGNGNYLVSTAEDLFAFSKIVNSGDWDDEFERTVLLTADIDLQNRPFTPIGYTQNYGDGTSIETCFYGTFDGQGHTIYNLNISAKDEATNDNSTAGLFGVISTIDTSKKTVIKNLKVDGATISGTHFAGVIVGNAPKPKTINEETQIIDCEVRNATVTSTYYNEENSGDKAGLIIGHAGKIKISGCHVENSTVIASRDAGQITGCAIPSNVTGCSATNVKVKWNGLGTGENIREALVGREL